MGRKRKGKKSNKSQTSTNSRRDRQRQRLAHYSEQRAGIREAALVPVLLEVWRTKMRAERDGAPESVVVACDRMFEACKDLSVRFETYVDSKFDENLRAEVVEHIGKGKSRRVSACLAPAIFINDNLFHKAQIVTEAIDK